MKLTQEQIDRVKAMEDAEGRITPDLIVEDAKDKKSPLHSLFEWDKTKAANAYWLDQAREVIVSVKLVVTNETTTFKAPAYVRATDVAGDQGYRSVTALRADPAQARESLIYTLEVANGHLRRAYDIAASLGLSADVDGIVERVVGLQRSVRTAA